jgi:hypothetical protein
MPGITEEKLGAIVRAIVREAILEARAAGLGAAAVDAPDEAEAPRLDLSPYDMVGYAWYVLEEAGAPMHVRDMARRMYELGFQHRRPPVNPKQLESSLNSLAAPSRQPSQFVRVGPRTLTLR